MTSEEFLDLCYSHPNLRLEQDKFNKVIVLNPSPLITGFQENEILADLGLWNRKYKLGKIFSPSTMFILPDGEKRMPDAAWVSMEKHKKLSHRERKKFACIVPDFIIEVRSPSDDLDDLKDKISNVWIANGVRLAWLIDPVDQKAFIFKPDTKPVEIQGFDHRLSGEDVLPEFEFDLSILKE